MCLEILAGKDEEEQNIRLQVVNWPEAGQRLTAVLASWRALQPWGSPYVSGKPQCRHSREHRYFFLCEVLQPGGRTDHIKCKCPQAQFWQNLARGYWLAEEIHWQENGRNARDWDFSIFHFGNVAKTLHTVHVRKGILIVTGRKHSSYNSNFIR